MSAAEEVKARLDIVDVISSYVELKKTGSTLKAPCPFHNERTPSFVVSPQRQSWHCFGACSTGGDVISFVMRREGVEFAEALRTLADRAGVTLASGAIQTKSATVRQVNDAAARFYQLLLFSEDGGKARAYLKDRGIDKEAAVKFRLGLSPSGDMKSSSLRSHLLAEGFTTDHMAEAGLLRRTEVGHGGDFFFGRLMFPIADRRGNILGFGGRTLDGAEPKYMNTAGTDGFDKSRLLYGQHLATEPIRARGEAVIVEGYMDVIAAHQHGHGNVVASMGTALTDTQLSQIRSIASRVTLAMDADAAGQEATVRKLEELLSAAAETGTGAYSRRVGAIANRQTMDIRIALLPEGSDPDDLIRNDPAAWAKTISGAVDGTDFMISWLPRRFDLTTGAGKSEAVGWVAGMIYAADAFDQERYRNDLASVLRVPPASLNPILQDLGKRRQGARRNAQARQAGPAQAPGPARQIPSRPRDAVEEYVLAMLLSRPELRELSERCTPECFDRSEDREIYARWLKADNIEDLKATLDPALSDRLDELLQVELKPTLLGQSEIAARQMFSRLEERRLRRHQAGLLSAPDALDSSQEVEAALVEMNARIRDFQAKRG